jgi:hypothetical protein
VPRHLCGLSSSGTGHGISEYYKWHREFKSLLGVKIAHLVDGSDLFKICNLV